MQEDFLSLMLNLAPDLAEEMGRRAMILERIAALQPIGRRQLAARINLPEREVRAVAGVLKDEGFIRLDAAGMALTPKAQSVLAGAREFSRAQRGLTALETTLSRKLHIPRVYVAAGDADTEEHVLADVGRMAANGMRGLLQSGCTLAVTGGYTMAQVAHFVSSSTPLNVMVVPARGGMGRTVETQANTLAAEIARRLGGHHRLIHLPDQMDQAAMQEMLKLPEIRETVELLQRADLILHGIGRADDMASGRRLTVSVQNMLREKGAVAEAFGSYFDREGNCLYSSSSVGLDLAALKPNCQMIAVSAGRRKAEAIYSVLHHFPHEMLVTDEGAARGLLALLPADAETEPTKG